MQVQVRKFVSRLLRKRVYVPLAVLYSVYVLVTWLWLPQFVQTQAVKFIETKTAHHLTMDPPSFNPFTITLHLSGLHLTEPDGRNLFSFRELDLNLSLTSALRLAAIFDSIRLDGAEIDVALLRNGKLNWTALVDSLSSKAPKPKQEASALPRLAITHFVLSNGHLNFTDENADFHTRVEPINLELRDISSLPDHEGIYSVVAHTPMGAQVSWKGKLELNPVTVTGTFNIDNFNLAQLETYFEKYLPGKTPQGIFDFSTEYQLKQNAQQLGLTLSNVAFKFRDFQLDLGRSVPAITIATIEATGGHFDQLANTAALGSLVLNGSKIDMPRNGGAVQLMQLDTLAIENAQVNLGTRNASLQRLAIDSGKLNAVRNQQGQIDLLTAFHGISPTTAAPPGKKEAKMPATKPWRYHVGKIDMEKLSVAFVDESVNPAAHLALNDIALHVEGISDNLAAPLPVRFALNAPDGGTLEIGGTLAPAPVKADMQIKLEGLALKPAQPYIASVSRLALAGGQFSTAGHATYDKHGIKYKGNFALNNLRLLEGDTRETFLAWRSLGSRDLTVTQHNLSIASLDIERLESKLIINKDKTVNISSIMKKPDAADNAVTTGSAAIPPVSSAPPAGEKTATATPREFITNIDRIRMRNSTMTFADHSLALPFDTRIHHMRANINNISSRPDTIGQLEMNGQVDDYGTAQANGQINLFNPTDLLNIKVLFKNIEMTRMTPYSTTFAGRKIDSGKLSLDLSYNIKQRQLMGDNKIIIDKLTLGERVESPTATELPLDLAIAILQDADGRIDLGLPVSGSLDDPKFSYGGIVWKALMNVMGKIITSPFRLIGAMLGGSGGSAGFDSIAFAAGDDELIPSEREKVLQVANVLNKRPGLTLTVHGTHADADKVALQTRQLRHELNKTMGHDLLAEDDTAPIVTSDPKVRRVLEDLYSSRVGRSELGALKDGFRQANPGQLEEGFGGKLFAALGWSRDKNRLNESEVAQLKGKDFYDVLYQRLHDREIVEDARLQALAKARGDYVMDMLKKASAPLSRVSLAEGIKVEAANNDVPIKLDLGAAPQPATAPSTTQPMPANAAAGVH